MSSAKKSASAIDHLPRLPDVDTSKMQEFTCEFCKQSFWVDADAGMIVHAMPFCVEFGAYDPVHYMRENNRIKYGKLGQA